MVKTTCDEWSSLHYAAEVNEPPTVVGLMLIRLLEASGYTPEDIRAIANTLLTHSASGLQS